jgi:hypothetical protein
MAAIVTKNRFFLFFLILLNIAKSQCCYQTIKEQWIYNSFSDHECFCSFGRLVSEEKNLNFLIVFYFLLIFFTNFQVWEAATAMFDGSRGHHSWSEKELYSIYGRFSIRIAQFVPIINKQGRHRQLLFLIGQFLNIFYSETW